MRTMPYCVVRRASHRHLQRCRVRIRPPTSTASVTCGRACSRTVPLLPSLRSTSSPRRSSYPNCRAQPREAVRAMQPTSRHGPSRQNGTAGDVGQAARSNSGRSDVSGRLWRCFPVVILLPTMSGSTGAAD